MWSAERAALRARAQHAADEIGRHAGPTVAPSNVRRPVMRAVVAEALALLDRLDALVCGHQAPDCLSADPIPKRELARAELGTENLTLGGPAPTPPPPDAKPKELPRAKPT